MSGSMRGSNYQISSGGNQLPLYPHQVGPEFQLFEIANRDDYFNSLSSQTLRSIHYELLSQIRLTDYQQQFDTITVNQKLVSEIDNFFDLIGIITSHKAFQEPCMFSSRMGKAQIDTPSWIDKIESTYLTVWIAALLEENLWAHYNYANNVNIEKNVRKNELQNLFETRSETLQSQEDLAKHWSDIGNKAKQRIVEQLRQKAKEIEIVHLDQSSQLGLDYFGNGEGSEFAHSFGNDETSRFYAGLSPKGYYNLSNMHNEELASILGSPSQYLGVNPSQLTTNQQMQLAASSPYRQYQFYHFNEIPVRPQFQKMQHELFSKDPESAYSMSLENKK